MKRCPRCNGSYGDDDVFCELDGVRLAGAIPVSPAAASAPKLIELGDATAHRAGASCSACGAAGSDDGDGYCSACGHRLDERATLSMLPPGSTIGGREVTSSRAPDEVNAKSADGTPVFVALGDETVLHVEGAAIRALAGHPSAPKLVELGRDERRGAFLAVAAPPPTAQMLSEAAPELDTKTALVLARAVLDLAWRLAQAGFSWAPSPVDLWLDEHGVLLVSRVRAARLSSSGPGACCAVAAVGRALSPFPAVTGTPRFFRTLTGTGCALPHPARDVTTMRAELASIEEEMARPYDGPPHAATECDAGLRRDHNEDATAMATGETRGEPWTVLVVCDGVSCSSHAEQASRVAAKTACDALAHFARSGDISHEAASGAMSAAIRAAHLAVCSAQIERGDGEPPGTTIVAGIVYRRRLTVGWVGDSRAYWVSPTGSELLTSDHSWATEAVARGDMTEEEAMRQPLAHALTRCLGPLESVDGKPSPIDPDVRARDLPGPGYVILCSDGLWNYFPDARAIAAIVRAAPPGATPLAIAHRLVNHALHRGGGDNVSVAIFAHAP